MGELTPNKFKSKLLSKRAHAATCSRTPGGAQPAYADAGCCTRSKATRHHQERCHRNDPLPRIRRRPQRSASVTTSCRFWGYNADQTWTRISKLTSFFGGIDFGLESEFLGIPLISQGCVPTHDPNRVVFGLGRGGPQLINGQNN